MPDKTPLNQLIQTGRLYNFSRGQVIQATDHNEKLILVKKGYVKRYLITDDGSFSIQYIYGPGQIFSITFLLKVIYGQSVDDGSEVFYYEAMTPTEVYSIGVDSLLKELEKNPVLYSDLFQVAGFRIIQSVNRLANLALKTYYNRVAHQLVYLAKEYGTKKGKFIKIELPLTHSDIAGMLNASRETISHAMSELKRGGFIKTDKYINIPDIKKLEKEAHRFME